MNGRKEIAVADQAIESKMFSDLCTEFQISDESVRKMLKEQFDIDSLKLMDVVDLEDIGISSVEAHKIVDCVTTKFFKISFVNGKRAVIDLYANTL